MDRHRDRCPVCKINAEIFEGPHNDFIEVTCPICGSYKSIDFNIFKSNLPNNDDRRPVLSHWIRKNQTEGKIFNLDTDTINYVLENFNLPTPKEQADNLLKLLGDKSKFAGKTIDTKIVDVIGLIGAYGSSGVRYILDYLKSEKLIVVENPSTDDPLRERPFDIFACHLTFQGWERYSSLNKSSNDSNIAFMAMKYGEEELEHFYKNSLKIAIEQTGFQLTRLDERLRPGLIDDQLRVEIKKARFLIVDLTHGNKGAYWEAGFAEGLGKPVVYICKESVFNNPKTKPHFDTNHLATVTWEMKTINDDLKKLKAMIRATFPLDAKMEDS